jgi:hypothetical protein
VKVLGSRQQIPRTENLGNLPEYTGDAENMASAWRIAPAWFALSGGNAHLSNLSARLLAINRQRRYAISMRRCR